jgi:hypothetical protein
MWLSRHRDPQQLDGQQRGHGDQYPDLPHPILLNAGQGRGP